MAADDTAPTGQPNSTPPEAAVNYGANVRKASQVLLRRLNRLPLATVAGALDKEESAACRVRSGERGCNAEEFCALLDVSGLKIVDKSKRCVDPKVYDFLLYIHQKSMGSAVFAQQLSNDDDPE